MAEVDFSNAIITPFSETVTGYTNINPTYKPYLGLNNDMICKVVNNTYIRVASPVTWTKVIDEQKQIAYIYSGTFTESGTSFHIIWDTSHVYLSGFTITNISFNAGDTFNFTINATLTCD